MQKKLTPYLLSLPLLLITITLFLSGFLYSFAQSFGVFPISPQAKSIITLKYYSSLISDPTFLKSLTYTIYISFFSAFISTIFGFAIAMAIRNLDKQNSALYYLYRSPIIIPHIVIAYLVFLIFYQTGFISRALFFAGLISNPNSFPLLIYDKAGIGIIIVYLFKQIPFTTLFLLNILEKYSSHFEIAAQNLGANFSQRLFLIVIPLVLPSLIAVFLISFAFDFGSFEVPLLLSSPAHPTLALKAYFDYTNADFSLRPFALADNVIISILSLCLIAIYFLILKVFNPNEKFKS